MKELKCIRKCNFWMHDGLLPASFGADGDIFSSNKYGMSRQSGIYFNAFREIEGYTCICWYGPTYGL